MRFWATGMLWGMVVLGSAGCALPTTQRGAVEFGRMRVATAVDVLPQPSEAPAVRYPEVLLAQGVEGTAELSFVVSAGGVPGDVQVQAASDPAFGEAAVAAVEALRYVPAGHRGKRVACEVKQTFFFRIR